MNRPFTHYSAATFIKPATPPAQPANCPPQKMEYSTVGALITGLVPDAPLFCLSREAANTIVSRFANGFPGTTTYALKACPLPELVSIFARSGVEAIDVASPQEMAIVRSVHASIPLHYNNPIRSDAETRQAYDEFSVRHYAVDDEVGLDRLNAVVPPHQRADVEVIVRLRAQKNAAQIDFTAKFGLLPADAAGLLQAVTNAGYRPALTFHPGSQCDDPQAFTDLIHASADLCEKVGVRIHTLNVGGGFPLPYGNTTSPQLEAFFNAIGVAFTARFDPAETRLVAEPGRALAGPTMSLLTQIKHIRADGTIFLNDGLYGGLMELMQIDIQLPIRVWRGAEVLNGPTRVYQAYGPTCCPLDRFPHALELPEDIAEGDRIEFGLTGAYGIATVTKFNGYGTTDIVHVTEILSPAC